MNQRVALVISSLGTGGAERVLSRLANHWASQGREVTILTLGGDEAPFHPLDPKVQLIPLAVASSTFGVIAKLTALLKRVRTIRTVLQQISPDVVVSFMDTTNILTLLATRTMHVPVVVSERIDPAQHDIGRFWSWLRARTYPWAHAVVMQTQRAILGIPTAARKRAKVIPNPVARATTLSQEASPPRLLAVGRLVEQKGFDLLLRAFARVADTYPDWTIRILGEGPARPDLERLSIDLGLNSRIEMPGISTSVGEEYAQATAFVLSSRFEGFPNVLCEAMAHGLPVAAFDCSSGPGEIITHEQDGLLVPHADTEALAKALARIMENDVLRSHLGTAATSISQRFSETSVLALWDDLIADALDSNH